jgi:hypothetical protein
MTSIAARVFERQVTPREPELGPATTHLEHSDKDAARTVRTSGRLTRLRALSTRSITLGRTGAAATVATHRDSFTGHDTQATLVAGAQRLCRARAAARRACENGTIGATRGATMKTLNRARLQG